MEDPGSPNSHVGGTAPFLGGEVWTNLGEGRPPRRTAHVTSSSFLSCICQGKKDRLRTALGVPSAPLRSQPIDRPPRPTATGMPGRPDDEVVARPKRCLRRSAEHGPDASGSVDRELDRSGKRPPHLRSCPRDSWMFCRMSRLLWGRALQQNDPVECKKWRAWWLGRG